jgi:hypothetical protein
MRRYAGANLLRHSPATDLLDRRASLREIADLLGHASLATIRIYAAVDVAVLREVVLPWPEATSRPAASARRSRTISRCAVGWDISHQLDLTCNTG